MGMPTSMHIVASSGRRIAVSPDRANDIMAVSPNVRLVIEVQHDLSVHSHSVSTSAHFDGSTDGLSATPGVATVTTAGPNGREKKPTIRRIVRKVASKVIPRVRKYSIQALLGRRKTKVPEIPLEETPEEPEPEPEPLRAMDPQPVPDALEPTADDPGNGVVRMLNGSPSTKTLGFEVPTHVENKTTRIEILPPLNNLAAENVGSNTSRREN
ncbi:MAG: hypothetical protein M1839_007994 [Geoglossum umbratile]|nr:MAG: hypothetical protein M1839_007994 [Geoglossum umbratile]